MTEAKKPDAKVPDTIIELVPMIDWRFVALAAIVGIVGAVVLLSLIEHTDDIPAPSFDDIDK